VVGKVVVLTGALMMARKEATAKYVSLSFRAETSPSVH
jgi:BRCT domain type II-containing protein